MIPDNETLASIINAAVPTLVAMTIEGIETMLEGGLTLEDAEPETTLRYRVADYDGVVEVSLVVRMKPTEDEEICDGEDSLNCNQT